MSDDAHPDNDGSSATAAQIPLLEDVVATDVVKKAVLREPAVSPEPMEDESAARPETAQPSQPGIDDEDQFRADADRLIDKLVREYSLEIVQRLHRELTSLLSETLPDDSQTRGSNTDEGADTES